MAMKELIIAVFFVLMLVYMIAGFGVARSQLTTQDKVEAYRPTLTIACQEFHVGPMSEQFNGLLD